jgi:hypothetical protein
VADKKISALTAASTPLAGTEVLPIVQSSVTVKVAVDDLTVKNVRSNATTGILQIAGPGTGTTRVMTTPNANFTAARTDAAQLFTGDQTLATGNLIQGTAAKGFNFTANTARAGMTSQLLNWYEEGTFTPTAIGITVVSGTPVYTGKFTRIGRQVTVDIVMTNLSGTITVASGNSFGSLPYSSATTSWGTYGDPGNANKGGFCTVSGGSVYLATANTYTNYFSLTITYSV